MDRDELINAMADAIFRLRSADPNVKSSDLARAALAVAEPVVFCSECHTSADSAAAWTAEKCEPPPELRGRDGWHWVQWPSGREVPQFWGGSDDEGCQWHAGTPTLSMRYLSPVLTPSEADALRAERDAAEVVKQSLTTELEKLRRKYKDDMHAALVEVGKWSWRSGSLEAELTTLRAEVEKLKRALKAADQFITNGIELGFIRMPDPSTPDPALETPGIIRAALESEP